MGEEVAAYVGEDALDDVVNTDGLIVILWTDDGDEVEDEVIEEEAGYGDGDDLGEVFVAQDEIEDGIEDDEVEIAVVAEVHELGEDIPWACLREEERRLAPKERLLGTCEDMVEVREYAVEFVGVGIPPCHERALHTNAQRHHGTAWIEAVCAPRYECGNDNADAAEDHLSWCDEVGVAEEDHAEGHEEVDEHGPFDHQGAFDGGGGFLEEFHWFFG